MSLNKKLDEQTNRSEKEVHLIKTELNVAKEEKSKFEVQLKELQKSLNDTNIQLISLQTSAELAKGSLQMSQAEKEQAVVKLTKGDSIPHLTILICLIEVGSLKQSLDTANMQVSQLKQEKDTIQSELQIVKAKQEHQAKENQQLNTKQQNLEFQVSNQEAIQKKATQDLKGINH